MTSLSSRFTTTTAKSSLTHKSFWIHAWVIIGVICLILKTISTLLILKSCQKKKRNRPSFTVSPTTRKPNNKLKQNFLNERPANYGDLYITSSPLTQPKRVCYRRGTYGSRAVNHPFLSTLSGSISLIELQRASHNKFQRNSNATAFTQALMKQQNQIDDNFLRSRSFIQNTSFSTKPKKVNENSELAERHRTTKTRMPTLTEQSLKSMRHEFLLTKAGHKIESTPAKDKNIEGLQQTKEKLPETSVQTENGNNVAIAGSVITL